jgi:hypothetical protein
MTDNYKPTAHLRWVTREIEAGGRKASPRTEQILQQWWAPDMPAYMQSGDGEWRDVPSMPVQG